MREKWDQRYAEQDFVYGKEPNGFFRSLIDKEKPGSILLPAEGEGRNAIYAASLGWSVYAVDFSRVAMQKALKRAEQESLTIHYNLADLAHWRADRTFDCIGLIYAHFSPAIRKELHAHYASLLNKNGKIILEAFSREQLTYNSGGPKDIDMLYSPKLLKDDFTGLRILYLEQMLTEVNESEAHNGRASIIRMIAEKI